MQGTAESSTTTGTGSDSSSVDGVAAATAAVLSSSSSSLSLGATLGSVSDAAVSSSALRPPGGCVSGSEKHGKGGETETEDAEDDDDELNEWMARHCIDFLDAAALLMSALSFQFCTRESCPAMRAGPRHEYLWAEPEVPGGGNGGAVSEEEKAAAENSTSTSSTSTAAAAAAAGKKKKHPPPPPPPSRLPAPDYCRALFSWADSLLASPSAFPQARGEPFPRGFKPKVLQPLYRRLARVFAHMYFAHWGHVSDSRSGLSASAHLNTVFKHYVAFGREHALLPEGELDPIRPLAEALLPPPPPPPPLRKNKESKKEGGERPLPPPPTTTTKTTTTKAAATAAGKTRVDVCASSRAAAP